jgi:hypothetical protein
MRHTIGIWIAAARLDNADHMAALLKPLPAAIAAQVRQLAGLLPANGENLAGMRYDAPSRRAFFLHGAGALLTCITFDSVKDIEQAAAIWAAIEDGTDCRAAYSLVTGVSMELIDARH